MLENLLKDLLNIETREDYRESRKGEIRSINLNDRCDKAYIRNRFRRHLKANRDSLEGVRMIDYNYNGVRYQFNDLNTLEDLNKVINIIENWINNCSNENINPLRIEFY